MTWILMGATFAMLTVLGVSCRRARLYLEEQLCECLQAPAAAAVGFGAVPDTVPAVPVLTGIEGGRRTGCGVARSSGDRHLRVVSAG